LVQQWLTPLATLYRYPNSVTGPSREQAEQAIDDATAIYEHVLSFLPKDFLPEGD
jgi:hypothetical protein